MNTMQIYITERDKKVIRRISEKLGISMSKLLVLSALGKIDNVKEAKENE
jgi:hypothetical protein